MVNVTVMILIHLSVCLVDQCIFIDFLELQIYIAVLVTISLTAFWMESATN